MTVFKTQAEVEARIKGHVLAIEGDVTFECHVSINASIIITAGNITAGNITAGNITAGNITAGDITAGNITAGNITAGNITAGNITAGNIKYWAFIVVYQNITCKSWVARREKHRDPICLDGKIEIIKDEEEPITEIKAEDAIDAYAKEKGIDPKLVRIKK